ncbi:hypothetical protein QU38_02925, partial [Staphylococcus aureus]
AFRAGVRRGAGAPAWPARADHARRRREDRHPCRPVDDADPRRRGQGDGHLRYQRRSDRAFPDGGARARHARGAGGEVAHAGSGQPGRDRDHRRARQRTGGADCGGRGRGADRGEGRRPLLPQHRRGRGRALHALRAGRGAAIGVRQVPDAADHQIVRADVCRHRHHPRRRRHRGCALRPERAVQGHARGASAGALLSGGAGAHAGGRRDRRPALRPSRARPVQRGGRGEPGEPGRPGGAGDGQCPAVRGGGARGGAPRPPPGRGAPAPRTAGGPPPP